MTVFSQKLTYGTTYYVQNKDSWKVFTETKDFDEYIKSFPDAPIICSNADHISRVGDVLDMRIFRWVIDNHYKPKYEKIDIKTRADVDNIFKGWRSYIEGNQEIFKKQGVDLIEKSITDTETHMMIARNHHFQLNRKELFKLQEEYSVKKNLKAKMPFIEIDSSYEELEHLSKGIRYDFIAETGKITNRGFNLARFNRKKHLELFRSDPIKKYYLVDFKQYEPTCLNYWIKDFITPDFYELHCEKYGLDRTSFKKLFIAHINGAGESSLGELRNRFMTDFPQVEEFRGSLSDRLKMFDRFIQIDHSYKRLSYLNQFTAGEFLRWMHRKVYQKEGKDFQIIWSLFDEFLIEGNPQGLIDCVNESLPIKFELKVEQV